MLALPFGSIVAVVGVGGEPMGAPGSPVVVVVPVDWPAAGAVAIRAAASTRPANPNLREAWCERDSINLSSRPVPPGGSFLLQTAVAKLGRPVSERSQRWTVHCGERRSMRRGASGRFRTW